MPEVRGRNYGWVAAVGLLLLSTCVLQGCPGTEDPSVPPATVPSTAKITTTRDVSVTQTTTTSAIAAITPKNDTEDTSVPPAAAPSAAKSTTTRKVSVTQTTMTSAIAAITPKNDTEDTSVPPAAAPSAAKSTTTRKVTSGIATITPKSDTEDISVPPVTDPSTAKSTATRDVPVTQTTTTSAIAAISPKNGAEGISIPPAKSPTTRDVVRPRFAALHRNQVPSDSTGSEPPFTTTPKNATTHCYSMLDFDDTAGKRIVVGETGVTKGREVSYTSTGEHAIKSIVVSVSKEIIAGPVTIIGARWIVSDNSCHWNGTKTVDDCDDRHRGPGWRKGKGCARGKFLCCAEELK